MISIHVSAVCLVRNGYTGAAVAPSCLICALDGAPYRPVGKPEGYLVLTNLPDGPHRLSLRGAGFQEELVEFETGGGITRELNVTMKPGAGYPFGRTVTRLTLALREGKRPAAGRQIWLAAPARQELKIAQAKAERGSAELRLFWKGKASPAVPGTYLVPDGKESEIVVLRALADETGTLADPLGRDHGRGRLLLPAQSYHADGSGEIHAAFQEPCVVEVFDEEKGQLGSLELSAGENRQEITFR